LQKNSEENAIGAAISEPWPNPATVSTAPTLHVPQKQPDALEQALERLWHASDATRFGITQTRFAEILAQAGEAQAWGGAEGDVGVSAKARFVESLRIDELILARACAAGNDAAWDLFLTRYREVLYRAAYSIARQESAGRELADSLYADLYGITQPGAPRRSRLESYMGRGSLAGWLRAVLAQRFVDDVRRTRREISLDEEQGDLLPAAPAADVAEPGEKLLAQIDSAIAAILARLNTEDRFLLVSHYLDGRALWQIATLLAVHESTISRRLERLIQKVRKNLSNELQNAGLSWRAAQEALELDVRDLRVNVRKVLQAAQAPPFEKEGARTSQ
jgi:RNA polymerase sigma-70 factor, ECF subfamily